MQINTRRIGNYMEVVLVEGGTTLNLGLQNSSEREALALTFREAADVLHKGENFDADTSDKIQNDIITCVDGFLEADTIYRTNLENMKSALCQIVVDTRK